MRQRWTWVIAYGALPAALLLRWLAFRSPEHVETIYAEGFYPWIARGLGTVNRLLPLPLAELAIAVLVGAIVYGVVRWWRAGRPLPRPAVALRRVLAGFWAIAGVGLLAFLIAWGFNYARAPLRDRMALDLADLRAEEVLALAGRFVELANAEHASLGVSTDLPTTMPLAVERADELLDAAYRKLALPGDSFRFGTSPAKPLLSSALFSRLGIGGIFIPFTGEPLFNAAVPDVSQPVSIAHEKAHQRGITDEGEANLAAVLACLSADDPYLRYAASLYASSVLVGEAARYAPDAAREVAAGWAPGPRQDLLAIREYWERYRGVATRAASRVNDAFLRSNRVAGGVQSYGRVASMLVGLQRAGAVPIP